MIIVLVYLNFNLDPNRGGDYWAKKRYQNDQK